MRRRDFGVFAGSSLWAGELVQLISAAMVAKCLERLFKRALNAELLDLVGPKVGQVVAHQGTGCEFDWLATA